MILLYSTRRLVLSREKPETSIMRSKQYLLPYTEPYTEPKTAMIRDAIMNKQYVSKGAMIPN